MSGRNIFYKVIDKFDDFVIFVFERWSYALIILIVLLSGFVLGVAATYTDSPIKEIADGEGVGIKTITANVINPISPEVFSPYDWIKEDQIHVYNDRIEIELEDAEWATFTDTNSMDPVIDFGSNAIEVIPGSPKDIHLGDIISYKSDYASGIIIHRVIDIGNDSDGWFCRTKGDNNNNIDPGKIRFSQVERIVVAVIY